MVVMYEWPANTRKRHRNKGFYSPLTRPKTSCSAAAWTAFSLFTLFIPIANFPQDQSDLAMDDFSNVRRLAWPEADARVLQQAESTGSSSRILMYLSCGEPFCMILREPAKESKDRRNEVVGKSYGLWAAKTRQKGPKLSRRLCRNSHRSRLGQLSRSGRDTAPAYPARILNQRQHAQLRS
jgi:hypothetical protein